MRSIYLDHAATTPVRTEVLDAMLPFFTDVYGNPSSLHSHGSIPLAALDRAREGVAGVLGCRPAEIVFTGGGTEADNLALLGVARALRERGDHIITTAIEHHAVLNAALALEREGFRVTYLPVDRDGLVDLDVLSAVLDDRTSLVSVMLANNEVGTIEPLVEITRMAHERGILVHTDAVQAAGALDLHVDRLGVDLMSLSAHKIYGPKGVGALFVRRGTPISPTVHGGDQERGRRSGTENVPGVVGLAVALALAERERELEAKRLCAMRDRLISGVLSNVDGVSLTGHPTQRLPGHASFVMDRVSGESVLVNLDIAGIACSAGSACRAGSTDPSHVLLALGISRELARNGLRMTLGRENDQQDVDRVLEIFPGILRELRGAQPAMV